MRYQLLVMPEPDGHNPLQKVYELQPVRSVTVEEVHAFMYVFDV